MPRLFGWWCDRQRLRNPLINPLVGTAVIEEGNVLSPHSSGIALAENQDVIHAFAPNTTEKSLTNGVGFWSLKGCVEQLV
jgi:hypothetical protein